MSSGFVSAGTTEEPAERDDEWRRAQEELEEERRRKAEVGKQQGGKSLYEVLQQNKMAKQEAFEESIRLKNQFRALDEDEVEFLDSLLESTRAKEAALKKETAEQLEAFHRQRQEADKALLESASGENPTGASTVEEEQWTISARKRRRDKKKESLLPGKKRKSSAAEDEAASSLTERKASPDAKDATEKPPVSICPTQPPPAKARSPKNPPAAAAAPVETKPESDAKSPDTKPPLAKPTSVALGLAGYSSDED